jgi:hypothetical protein
MLVAGMEAVTVAVQALVAAAVVLPIFDVASR